MDKGGTLAIEQDPTGGQFGVCNFPENHQCEEWALLRGECPVGGIRVTGFVTPAARFCGITGGKYATTGQSNTSTETGTCLLPSGETCDADAYFRRTCPAPKSESGTRLIPSPRELSRIGNPDARLVQSAGCGSKVIWAEITFHSPLVCT